MRFAKVHFVIEFIMDNYYRVSEAAHRRTKVIAAQCIRTDYEPFIPSEMTTAQAAVMKIN